MSDPIEDAALSGGTAAEIALSVEGAISAGRLAPGARLPTVRELAARLAVSPATVNAAYRTLRNRGLVAAAGRAGTRVLERTAPTNRALGAPVGPGVRDLADGNPDPALLPPLQPALAKLSGRQWLYGESGALPALLDWFRLDFERDGLTAEHLAVAGGAMDAIERVLQAHLWPGDAVIVEDPAFGGVLDLVSALGLRPIAVPVDNDGLRADLLQRALEQRPAACVLTPRAQNPTGAALSPERAAELRKAFQGHENILLIEDDHAAAIAGTEPETVTGDFRHWAVIRSVTKYLGPDLRLSVLNGDQFTVDRFLRRQQVGAGWASHLLQELAVTMLRDPATPTLLATARETYRERRRVLADALGRRGITLSGRSGFNGWIPTPAEGAVAQALLARGWAVRTGEAFRTNAPPGLRVTFANLSPEEAEDFAATLHAILQGDGRGYPA
ncbi:aminotransferase class I/II-fold pyridoxal phosphate-dependent enzyme [Amycolatopsis nivea]